MDYRADIGETSDVPVQVEDRSVDVPEIDDFALLLE